MKQPSLIIVAASLVVAFGLPAAAQAEDKAVMTSSPGQASIAQKRKIVATVEAIDVAKREVTLKGPKGKVVPLSVVAGRAQPRAGQGRRPARGDLCRGPVAHAQEGRQGDSRPGTPRPTPSRSAAGAKPGGAVAEHIKVTADVIAVDQKTHMVTLRGPKQEVDLYVADPAQLKLIKVGDQIEAVYTQALAVAVEPAKK